MSKTLRPSAGYIGRGVIDQSAVEYMLYHQKSFEQVNPGWSARNSSQTLRPRTRWFDCFQNWTSASSRWYQPLATIPCSDGSRPVRYVDWAVQVTAGMTGSTRAIRPPRAKSARRGAEVPTMDSVSPTTLMTAVRGMAGGRQR